MQWSRAHRLQNDARGFAHHAGWIIEKASGVLMSLQRAQRISGMAASCGAFVSKTFSAQVTDSARYRDPHARRITRPRRAAEPVMMFRARLSNQYAVGICGALDPRQITCDLSGYPVLL
jgi:hypothetical protein